LHRSQQHRPPRTKHPRSSQRKFERFPLYPDIPRFSKDLDQSRADGSRRLRNSRQARKRVREATPSIAANVSNRNGAHAHRNRIFLRGRHRIFVAKTLQSPTLRLIGRANQLIRGA